MLKWCLLHDEENLLCCKSLIYSILNVTLIFRVFASEEESARKYSFIFLVEQKTQMNKSQNSEKQKVAHIG